MGNASVRQRLDAGDVIIAVALLCHPVPGQDSTYNQRLVGVFLAGLFPDRGEDGGSAQRPRG